MKELEEEKKQSLQAWKKELKDTIITDIFNGDKDSAPYNFDLNVLGARVSTKESNTEIAVNPSGEVHVGRVTPPMGLYVQRYTGYVMTFEVGAVLEDANWQAPVNCFDENDKEKNIPILGSAVRGGSLGSYDVGSATWADLRKAPLQSAMEVTYICVHFVLKELVRKSISETEVSNVSAMSQQCFRNGTSALESGSFHSLVDEKLILKPSEVSIFTLKVVVAHQEICASKGFVFSQIICYMYRSSLQGIKTFIYTILGTVTIQRRVPLSLVIDIIIEQGMMASGKTTVGRILSEALSYSSFYDRLVW
ncbi:hypothetical protein JHK85_034782 [Glycine max]|nr:hypothetical protein JHK85_034782 [Glycine max]